MNHAFGFPLRSMIEGDKPGDTKIPVFNGNYWSFPEYSAVCVTWFGTMADRKLTDGQKVVMLHGKFPDVLKEGVDRIYAKAIGQLHEPSDPYRSSPLYQWDDIIRKIGETGEYEINIAHPGVMKMTDQMLFEYFTIHGFLMQVKRALFDDNWPWIFKTVEEEFRTFPQSRGGMPYYQKLGVEWFCSDFNNLYNTLNAQMRASNLPRQHTKATLHFGPGCPCPLCGSEDETGLHLPIKLEKLKTDVCYPYAPTEWRELATQIEKNYMSGGGDPHRLATANSTRSNLRQKLEDARRTHKDEDKKREWIKKITEEF